MVSNIEKSKWIDVRIGFAGISSILIPVKKELNEYAKELGWTLKIDKKYFIDNDGSKKFNITLHPTNKLVSPIELIEKEELLHGFSVSIVKDIMYKGREEELPDNIQIQYVIYTPKNKKPRIHITYAKILIFDFELEKGISLEKQKPNMFKLIFGISLNELYKENLHENKKLFLSEEQQKNTDIIIKAMEESGIDKQIIPKSFVEKIKNKIKG